MDKIVILSGAISLLSSLLLNAILLIFSVYTSCPVLLNLCCDFNTTSPFNKHFL